MPILIKINQSLLYEHVPDNIIDKICNIANGKILETIDSNSNFIGNISLNNAYRTNINFINIHFPNLNINVTNYYILFEDNAIKTVIFRLNNNNDVLESDAAEMILGTTFQNNTNIEYFNEFKYFTNSQRDIDSVSSTYSFKGCTNLKEITLSPSTTILAQDAFWNCTSLTKINNFSNVRTLYRNALKNCSNLAYSEGCLDLSNIRYFGTECISNTVCNQIKFYSGAITFNSNSLYGCQAKYLIDLDLSLLTILGNNVSTNIGASFINMQNLRGRWEFSNISNIFIGTFTGCPYIEELSFPNSDFIVTDWDVDRLWGLTRCKKITIGKVRYLKGGRSWGSNGRRLFGDNTNLAVVDFGDQIESYVPDQPYTGCTNLQAVIFRVNTPPITVHSPNFDSSIHSVNNNQGNLNNPPSFNHINYFNGKTPYIFVPDAAVNTWKTDSIWSFAADKIRPLSEYVESDFIIWSTNVVFGRTHHKTFDLENPPENIEDYINN